eukprot:CAMPEP_0170542908 /NCGR_PEP_ID=MMETSP0211-20121228/2193_1 /TAXON_ID=311385 /ORGANISM="Pseudokeronopsis sp., Strain OXSARD2" /LENGTH=101 /DNA_ID=CAMNT_0010846129 /DNA_START=1876 /DNA_END=2181 /DNA_ORIENTATION=-
MKYSPLKPTNQQNPSDQHQFPPDLSVSKRGNLALTEYYYNKMTEGESQKNLGESGMKDSQMRGTYYHSYLERDKIISEDRLKARFENVQPLRSSYNQAIVP